MCVSCGILGGMDLFNGHFYKFFIGFMAIIVAALGVILVVGGMQ